MTINAFSLKALTTGSLLNKADELDLPDSPCNDDEFSFEKSCFYDNNYRHRKNSTEWIYEKFNNFLRILLYIYTKP